MDIQTLLLKRNAFNLTSCSERWFGTFKLICRASLVTALMLLIGCSEGPTTSLSIGTNNWIGYQPFYIAREMKYYDSPAVKLVELNNSTDIMHELRSAQLDGAALTMDEVLTLLEQGLDMQVVLVVDISDGGDVLLAKPGIESIQQLKGKQVAVEYTAVGATMLDAALSNAGLTTRDIDIVPCAWDRHVDCFQDTSAVVTFEPVKTHLLKQGASLLFDSSQIKGRITDVLAIRAEVIADKADEVVTFIQGYFKALEYMQQEPAGASQIIQQRTKLNAAEVVSMLEGINIPGRDGNKQMLSQDKLHDNTLQLIELMVDKDLLKAPVSIDQLFTSQYLP